MVREKVKKKKVKRKRTYKQLPPVLHRERVLERKKSKINNLKLLEYPSYTKNPSKLNSDKNINIISLSQDSFEDLSYLSRPALVILAYIIKTMKVNQEIVVFTMQAISRQLEYKSKSNLYLGLIELLQYKFLYKTSTKSQYYVNFKYKSNIKE